MRIFGRPLHQRGVPARVIADAAEMRLKNMHARGRIYEAEKWEKRLRELAASFRAHCHLQAAIDLEEVVSELAGKKGE